MFNLRDFILRGLKQAIGNEPEYKIIQLAAGWLDKGVLMQEDLAEIDLLLQPETSMEEEITE